MENQITNKIIKFVAERGMVKYIQFIEISLFMLCGYTINVNFVTAAMFLSLAIIFAIIAGESALLEHDFKKGGKNGH